MPASHTAAPALQDHLTEPLRLGEPDVHGPLAVFPIFGPAPGAEYVFFSQGRAAVVLIGRRPAVLDHVSRPEVFAALHAPLVQGYGLDALENDTGIDAAARPGTATAEAFLRHILRARITEHDGIGLGRDVRFAQGRVAGAGLVVGDELVQLTAFPEDDADGEAPVARIRRPSRRQRQ